MHPRINALGNGFLNRCQRYGMNTVRRASL
jgi:hypothetical protein